MSNFKQKLAISLESTLLFFIVNHPNTYKLTSCLFNKTFISNYCPTNLGIFLHTLIFFTISYLTMNNTKINNLNKIKHSLYGTLIYFFISSQVFYSFIQLILNNYITNCPTIFGILIQSLIYCITLILVMYLP